MNENDVPDMDYGVNPNDVYKEKNWEGKGNLNSIDAVRFAIVTTIQTTNFETEDVLSKVVKALTIFSGSVGGKDNKNNLFMQGAGIRIRAEDMKQTEIKTGGK